MLKEFVNRITSTPLKIAVVGDCMIDEWWDGEVNRISPEAPVPIFACASFKPMRRPGGAGNVAAQLKSWGVEVDLYGFMDEQAAAYYRNDFGISTIHCPRLTDTLIPRKVRYMCGDVQVHRVDLERPSYGLKPEQVRKLQERIKHSFNSDGLPDVIILSDYAKGVFDNGPGFLDMCVMKGGKRIPVIVDPKRGPLSAWRGCTIYKPNQKEAEALSGVSSEIFDPELQTDFFVEKLGCQAVVITHGAGGVTGKSDGLYFEYAVPWVRETQSSMRIVSPREVPVHSVVGAGDCFLSFLAMAVGVGFPVEDAAKIAFEAGAIYVTHRWNMPVTSQELLGSHVDNKIRKPEECPTNCVFTNGCFDVLHTGHLSLLRYAKSLCEPYQSLVVAINSDASVKRLKGDNRPINNQEKRAELLAALECVDMVTIFDEDTPLKVIEAIRPEVIVKGGDYTRDQVVGNDLVPRVYIFPTVPGYSTTKVIASQKESRP